MINSDIAIKKYKEANAQMTTKVLKGLADESVITKISLVRLMKLIFILIFMIKKIC